MTRICVALVVIVAAIWLIAAPSLAGNKRRHRDDNQCESLDKTLRQVAEMPAIDEKTGRNNDMDYECALRCAFAQTSYAFGNYLHDSSSDRLTCCCESNKRTRQ